MMFFRVLAFCVAALLRGIVPGVASSDSAPDRTRPDKPNIILLLVDDLGWQDVKCYDVDEPSPMETPWIDALAKRGVMFWQAYAPGPTCAPSRAAILSGTHPARAHMTHVSGGKPPSPHHPEGWSMMSPWYSARMPAEEVTLAEALKANGYVTGHSGKWHVAKNHHAYPQPEDQGFDYTRNSRGLQVRMQPDRLTGFATRNPDDPFRLDEQDIPFDQTHADAMAFLEANHDRPFFLFYAMWMVHSPWVMHSEPLLMKYVRKLGVELTPEAAESWTEPGQRNPFYCAMVEQMDTYVGRLVDYLERTEDPRWPGHSLMENTYLIFLSDNGGMEGTPQEIVTDNLPLDQGKISLKEGGVRIPMVILGPNIPSGVQSGVMVNGLDLYPTLLSLVGAPAPAGKLFDGADLSRLLQENPSDPALVLDSDGTVRDTMVWHFPNSSAFESSIRVGDYKLIRNYDHVQSMIPGTVPLELYRLYRTEDGTTVREDIGETQNLVAELPGLALDLDQKLTGILTGMGADYPYYNPETTRPIPHRDKTPEVVSHQRHGRDVWVTYRPRGAEVVRAQLIYTPNGGDPFEEWFRAPAEVLDGNRVHAILPEGATHFFINLVDENNFLVGYPRINAPELQRNQTPYSGVALSAADKATP